VSWVYTVVIQVGSYLLRDREYRISDHSTRGLGLLYQWSITLLSKGMGFRLSTGFITPESI